MGAGNKKYRLLRGLCYVIFAAYVLGLMKIILFKYTGAAALLEKIVSGNVDGFRSVNLVPFRTLIEFGTMAATGDFFRGFINLAGNMLVFAPLGWFLPLLFKTFRKFKNVLAAGVLTSLLFECCQYVFYLGSADIDDVLLNTAGVAVGFVCLMWLRGKTKGRPAIRYGATAVLSVIGFIAAFFVAADYFGLMFGIKEEPEYDALVLEEFDDIQIETNAENEFDILGDIVSVEEDMLVIRQVIEIDESMALSGNDSENLQTIHLLPATVYWQLDIHDIEGRNVETKEAGAEDLQTGQLIDVKGYMDGTEFFATEIVINNYLF